MHFLRLHFRALLEHLQYRSVRSFLSWYAIVFTIVAVFFVYIALNQAAYAAETCTISTSQNEFTLDQSYISNTNCQYITITYSASTPKLLLHLPENIDLIGEGTITVEQNAVVVLDGPLTVGVDDAVIVNGIIEHQKSDTRGVQIEARNIEIHSSGRIDVMGKGCSGGEMYHDGSAPDLTTQNGSCIESGTGAGKAGGSGGAGGGYGGMGAGALWAAGGLTYGINEEPRYLGSGGGSGATYNDGATGSAGGGAIRLLAYDTLDIQGMISADGKQGNSGWQYGGGGGSGGSIWITTNHLTGNGIIRTNGGDAGKGNSNVYAAGGGGGGRVHVEYQEGNFPVTNISATKGNGGTTENGTAFIVQTDYTGATHLSITSGLLLHDDGDYTHDSITVYPDANIRCALTQPLTLSAVSLTWNGGTWTCNSTLPSLTINAQVLHTENVVWKIPNTKEVSLNVNQWESAGTNNAISITTPGAHVRWNIEQDLILHAVHYVGPQHAGTTDKEGGMLTIDNPISVTLVNSSLNSNIYWNNIHNLTIDNNSSITANGTGCRGGGGTVNVENADGHGPKLDTEICTVRTAGFGLEGGTGAAYGGTGGWGWGMSGTTKSIPYGTKEQPIFFGSGGGGSCYGGQGCSKGGNGGGIIRINVEDTLSVDGVIAANGELGNASSYWYGAGGGSGGSVYVSTAAISGSGSITATGNAGGDGASSDGSGGGGGRIAIYYITNASSIFQNPRTVTDQLHVEGASGSNGSSTTDDGTIGTVYLHQYTVPEAPLMQSPRARTYNNALNPDISSSEFISNGKPHTSTDWKITTDPEGNQVVWEKNNTTDQLHEIHVDASNGTFVGQSAGKETLDSFTTYYAFARYENVVGDSAWSSGLQFTTVYTGDKADYTWNFNEQQPDDFYAHATTTIDVNTNGNGVARLYPQDDPMYGTYAAAGLTQGTEGWHKRKKITVQNPAGTDLVDYPIRIEVTHDHRDMQSDFDDIRFTTDDGKTELSYWRESWQNNTSAIFWVKMPRVSGNQTTDMYIYYGKEDVSTTSNGDAVFPFFDDFTTLDSAWTEISHPASAIGTLQNGSWIKNCQGECDWWSGNTLDAALMMPTTTFGALGNNWEAVTRMSSASMTGNRHTGMMLYNDTNPTDNQEDGFMWGFSPSEANFDVERVGAANQCRILSTTVPAYLKIRNIITNPALQQFEHTFWRSDTGAVWNGCLRQDNSLYTDSTSMGQVGLFVKDWDGGQTTATYDFFFVKPYTAVEPVVTIATDEQIPFSYNEVAIIPAQTGFHPEYGQLYTFSYAQIEEANTGGVRFQIGIDADQNGSVDGWYYHNGTQWTSVMNDMENVNTAEDVNAFLPAFVSEIGIGQFYFKAFLLSDGTQPVQLDGVTVTYDGPPPFSTIPEQTLHEDTPAVDQINVPDYFSDSTHRLTYSIIDDLDAQYGTVSISAEGKLSIYPAENVWGDQLDTIQIRATTPGGYSTDSNPIAITILPENDVPIAVDDTQITPVDQPIQLTVLQNDSDSDGDQLIITSVAQPEHGSVVIQPDQHTITYTATSGFSGVDQFMYTISDGNGGTTSAFITITISSAQNPPVDPDPVPDADDQNHPPLFTGALPSVSFFAGTTTVPVFNLHDYFSDEDGDVLQFSVVGNTEVDVHIDANGEVHFSAASTFTGVERIYFMATDSNVTSAQSNTIPITVAQNVPRQPTDDDTQEHTDSLEDTTTNSPPTDEHVSQNTPDSCDDHNGIDGNQQVPISHITGTPNGKGIVTVYGTNQEVIRCWETFSGGGVIPQLGSYNGAQYVYSIKQGSGSSLHIEDIYGNTIAKKRLSTRVHIRRISIGQLDNVPHTQEIVIAIKRGSSIYLKIFTFNMKKNTITLTRQVRHRDVWKPGYQVKTKHKHIILKNHSGKTVFKWKPF